MFRAYRARPGSQWRVHRGDAEQTALFYVGIPALIALTVVATARPRSTLGTIMATITVGLALAGPLLDQGVVQLCADAFGAGPATEGRVSPQSPLTG